MHCCIAQRFRSIIIVFRLILELDSQRSCEYSTDRSCNRSDILPQIGCYSPGSLSLIQMHQSAVTLICGLLTVNLLGSLLLMSDAGLIFCT